MLAVIEVHWSVPRKDQTRILLSRGRAVQPGILVAGCPGLEDPSGDPPWEPGRTSSGKHRP